MKRDVRNDPKPQRMWAVYNWGILWSVYSTRREALLWCREEVTKYPTDGKATPWQDVFEVHKAIVTKA